MQLYLAIDIRDGRVVRYFEGEETRETVYSGTPVSVAQDFLAQGADWLHVVDLDRAFSTGGDNSELVSEIAGLPGVSLQLGGGVRTAEEASEAMKTGAARLVIATAAALEPNELRNIVSRCGSARLALAIDVRNGRTAIRGSAAAVPYSPDQMLAHAVELDITTIIYRDLSRDGTLDGSDIGGAAPLIGRGADVLLAGGVASLDDIRAARDAGVAGTIVGRALYEGRFSLRQAIECSK